MTHTVTVDMRRCDGNGTCAALMPAHFDLDENGDLVVLSQEVADADREALEQAILCCPTGAISDS